MQNRLKWKTISQQLSIPLEKIGGNSAGSLEPLTIRTRMDFECIDTQEVFIGTKTIVSIGKQMRKHHVHQQSVYSVYVFEQIITLVIMYQPTGNQQPQYPPNQINQPVIPGYQLMLPQQDRQFSPSSGPLVDGSVTYALSTIFITVEGFSNASLIYCLFWITRKSIYDDFSDNGYLWALMSIVLGFAISFARMLLSCWYCCYPNASSKQKTAVAVSILIPNLKYHVIRQNPNYQGKLIVLFRNDVSTWVYLLFMILCGVMANDSVVNSENQDRNFFYYACVSLMALLSSLVGVMIHLQWIKKMIKLEQLRLIQQAMIMPLMMDQPMIINQPLANQSGQYGGAEDGSIVAGQPLQASDRQIPVRRPYQPND